MVRSRTSCEHTHGTCTGTFLCQIVNRIITFVVLFLYALIIFVQTLLFCDFVQMDSLLDKIASGRITIYLMCLATKYLCAVRLHDLTGFS